MKKIMIISLISIFSLFLNSCDEDKDNNDENKNGVINLTDDYQYQVNTNYKYKLEYTVADSYGSLIEDAEIYFVDIFDFVKFKNENSLLTYDSQENTQSYYVYKDNKIMNSFFINDRNGNLIESIWIDILNLNENEWVAADYKIDRPNENDIKFSVKVTGKKIEDIEVPVETGEVYEGIKIELSYDFYFDFKNSFDEIVDQTTEIERTILFIKGYGIMIEDVESKMESNYLDYSKFQVGRKGLMSVLDDNTFRKFEEMMQKNQKMNSNNKIDNYIKQIK